MFTSAQVKLTFWYSLLFFVIFWSFSSAIYVWMSQELGTSYISQVRQHQGIEYWGPYDEGKTTVVTLAGEVALAQLRRVLVMLDLLFLVIIPPMAWILVKWTLEPIQASHVRQKQFISDASHELRTPLSIISGEIEVTLGKNRKADEYKNVLSSTKEEIDRLSKLVKNLLLLARNDRDELVRELVDLTDLLSSVIVGLNPKAKKKNQTIEFLPAESPSMVMGNNSLISQVFYNLIDNAITYSPAKSKIEVVLTNRRKSVVVQIKDKGIGMSKADVARIFDRFYRADESRSGIRGYGLGLAICQSVINKHGGTIMVNSKQGAGSTFTVELPE